MKTVSRTLLAALALVGCSQAAAGQSVDDIVEKHLAASGGRAALEKVTSRVMTGTIALTTPAGDLAGPIQISNMKPGKEATSISLDLSALGAGMLTVDRRFDGTTGYVSDSLQGDRNVSGLELANMRDNAYGFPSPALNYKQNGTVVTLLGKEKVGNRDAFVLNVQPKGGTAGRIYIDADTFLAIRSVTTAEAPEVGQFEQTTDLLDYREVDGLKVPFQIKSTSSAQSFTITLSKVEHNVKVDPAIFARPEK
jgi:outer membrane lipoprotein-sorting protein